MKLPRSRIKSSAHLGNCDGIAPKLALAGLEAAPPAAEPPPPPGEEEEDEEEDAGESRFSMASSMMSAMSCLAVANPVLAMVEWLALASHSWNAMANMAAMMDGVRYSTQDGSTTRELASCSTTCRTLSWISLLPLFICANILLY
jgi:hypothetical protein